MPMSPEDARAVKKSSALRVTSVCLPLTAVLLGSAPSLATTPTSAAGQALVGRLRAGLGRHAVRSRVDRQGRLRYLAGPNLGRACPALPHASTSSTAALAQLRACFLDAEQPALAGRAGRRTTWRLEDDFQEGSGRVLTLQQLIDGVPTCNGVSKLSLRNGLLVAFSGRVVPPPTTPVSSAYLLPPPQWAGSV